MNAPFFAIAMVAAACAGSASAGIFRCKDAAGGVTYQEIPCASADERALNIPTAFPEVNYTERDRLLRREAELDARMLRRAEIDAQVQIAREERLAREREAELQREAANDTPLWIVPAAYRNPWRNVHRRANTQKPQPRWP